MKKMKENPHEHKNISPYTMEGYLYVQEKRRLGRGVVGAGEGDAQHRGTKLVQSPWKTGMAQREWGRQGEALPVPHSSILGTGVWHVQ